MPRGRCRRGWGNEVQGEACSRRVSRFLEPCLLLLLRQNVSHGYNLVDELQRAGFASANLDASIVYRMLREMEQEGWVSSSWDTSGAGPPRRLYRISAEGEEYLRWWIADLQRTRAEIERFIALYESSQPPAHSASATAEPGETIA